MSEEKKAYYAVIPANVRYDKRLPAHAKLLYGEITALCNEKGYCWASNRYFAELYKTSQRSITSWISALINAGYIKSVVQYKNGSKEISNRYLSLIGHPIEENFHTYRRNLPQGIEENFHTPIEENFQDNITSMNNTENITCEYKKISPLYSADNKNTAINTGDIKEKSSRFFPPTLEEVSNYCFERNNKIDAERFIDYYQSKGWKVGTAKMTDWKSAIRNWERRDKEKEQPKWEYDNSYEPGESL